MAIGSNQVAVTSTPAVVVVPAVNVNFPYNQPGPTRSVTIVNGAGGQVFLGGPGVTTATGLPLAASSSISISLYPGDALYAIAAGATSTVAYLESGA
jgi:hypothetical protein